MTQIERINVDLFVYLRLSAIYAYILREGGTIRFRFL